MSAALNRTKSAVSAGALACLVAWASLANAEDFTAGVVMTKMDAKERSAYMAGVIEGLAYARYHSDGNKTDGMGCIYRWYYETDGTIAKIHSAFDAFPDYLSGAVIAAMVGKVCGE